MRKIFDWLRPADGRRRNTSAKMETKASNPGLVAFHSGGSATWSLLDGGGYARNGFCSNPVVYRCVRMISEAAANLSLVVRENHMDLDEHPLLELLAKPNERQARAEFMEALYGHLLIAGNAYVTRVAIDEITRELHVLDPAKVSPVVDEKGWPVAFDFTVGGSKSRLNAQGQKAEILHLSLFNPASDLQGLSPLAPAHMALDIHNAASSWNKALLDNSARPSGALVYAASTGDNLSEDQFDRLKDELEQGYTGATRAGRPMLLEGGLDWKAMGFSPRDMDFLEAKNGAAREIALAFGVPPMLLGIPGDNTYSNYQEANRAFWHQTVLPIASKTACDLGLWLMPEFDTGAKLVIDTEKIAALASEREAFWTRIGQADFLTDDEKRQALGFGKQ